MAAVTMIRALGLPHSHLSFDDFANSLRFILINKTNVAVAVATRYQDIHVDERRMNTRIQLPYPIYEH